MVINMVSVITLVGNIHSLHLLPSTRLPCLSGLVRPWSNTMALTRSHRNRILAGVCSGIAESQNRDPTVVRLLCLLLTGLTGIFPGLVAYGALWAVMAPPAPGASDRALKLPTTLPSGGSQDLDVR